ncbi:MAG: c-type cytochrome [bacterium]|nr:c-type cytochrome [bacterium]
MKLESRIQWAFALGAFFLLLSHGIIVYRNFNTDWRTYQQTYLSKVQEMTTDEQLKTIISKRQPRIEQLVVRDFGENRVDRCLTCHLGIDDDRFRDTPQPFTTHPQIAGDHPVREVGCTVCHDGNGRGLSADDAHGYRKHWIKPLLTGDYSESACAKCHPSPYLAETPLLRKGAELFKLKACYGCHKVEGVSDGRLGVELTEVGSKWPIEYLTESIVDPKANNRESLMPRIELTEDEVKSLSIYLKSLNGEDLAAGPVPTLIVQKEWAGRELPTVEINYSAGEELFNTKSCKACHTLQGEGGNIAPELSVVGLQRSKEWIIEHFIDPRALVAGSIMPDFKLSQSEMEALTTFLLQQTEKPE